MNQINSSSPLNARPQRNKFWSKSFGWRWLQTISSWIWATTQRHCVQELWWLCSVIIFYTLVNLTLFSEACSVTELAYRHIFEFSVTLAGCLWTQIFSSQVREESPKINDMSDTHLEDFILMTIWDNTLHYLHFEKFHIDAVANKSELLHRVVFEVMGISADVYI